MTEFSDKAIVCPNCLRDLMFFIPLAGKVDQLGNSLEEFVAQLRDVKLEQLRPVSKREAGISRIFDAVKLLVIYAVQWLLLIPLVEQFDRLELALYWGYALTAVPYGAWLGYRYSRGDTVYTVLTGAALALTNLAIRGTLYAWTWHEASLFFVSDMLWFYTGNVVGRKVARWAGSGDAVTKSPVSVAELLLGEPTPAKTTPSLNERSERLKAYAAVLVPLLSIIATLIAMFGKR